MNILDDQSKIEKLDQGQTLTSIKKIGEQCSQAWREINSLNLPPDYANIKNIVVAGMGGSSFGVRIIKSLYDQSEFTKVPLELANSYRLPGYVNFETLVILSSYSGNTEETLSCAEEAKQKQAKILGITCGGSLGDFLKENSYPCYLFNPLNNPSAQPRMGIGYMIVGLVGLLSKLGFIRVSAQEISALTDFLSSQTEKYSVENLQSANYAKQLAVKTDNKIPIFIAESLLDGPIYGLRNMYHETGKQFAVYFTIPELNHHLLEGLQFPENFQDKYLFVFINSPFYDKRNQRCVKLTREIILKYKYAVESITLQGSTPLIQSMELLQLGSWASFYLAILHNVDPAKIPYVDYFKKQLSAISG